MRITARTKYVIALRQWNPADAVGAPTVVLLDSRFKVRIWGAPLTYPGNYHEVRLVPADAKERIAKMDQAIQALEREKQDYLEQHMAGWTLCGGKLAEAQKLQGPKPDELCCCGHRADEHRKDVHGPRYCRCCGCPDFQIKIEGGS